MRRKRIRDPVCVRKRGPRPRQMARDHPGKAARFPWIGGRRDVTIIVVTAHAARTWFLCTLLVVGLLPMPAATAGEPCCESIETAVPAIDAAPVPSPCCDEAAAPCHPDVAMAGAATTDANADTDSHSACDQGCEDCRDCDGDCSCLRCGCHPAGSSPAMRARPSSLGVVGPAATLRAPDARCLPRDATEGLLRPPRH